MCCGKLRICPWRVCAKTSSLRVPAQRQQLEKWRDSLTNFRACAGGCYTVGFSPRKEVLAGAIFLTLLPCSWPGTGRFLFSGNGGFLFCINLADTTCPASAFPWGHTPHNSLCPAGPSWVAPAPPHSVDGPGWHCLSSKVALIPGGQPRTSAHPQQS